MKKVLISLLVLAIAFAAFANGTTESTDGVVTLKLGTTAPGGAVNESANMFAKNVEAVSGGKLTVDVHTASTLGNTAQLYAQLKEGTLDFFVTAFDTATVLKDGGDFAIVCVPYVFDDYNHFLKFVDSDMCAKMVGKVEKTNGLHFVGLVSPNLPRGLSTTKLPVYTVDDVKNLKLRCPETKGQFQMWEMWGANPLIINGGQSYTAIEQGIADGQDNDIWGTYSSGYAEIQKYYMEINYIQQANIIWGSAVKYGKYTEQQKAWIAEALHKTYDEYAALLDKNYKKAKEAWVAAGSKFIDVNVDSFKQATFKSIPKLEANGIIPAGVYEKVRALNK